MRHNINNFFWRPEKREWQEAKLFILAFLFASVTFLGGYILIMGEQGPAKGLLAIEPLPDYQGSPAEGRESLENGPKQALKAFVASQNGKKYYPSDCPSANKILIENRIWFSSEYEAREAG